MKKIIAIACLSLAAANALAEGYQVNSQSAKQAAMGHVGAAMHLGAESMHFNPAGLAFMQKPIDLSLGGTAVFSNISYKNGNYKAETDNAISTPLYVYAGFKIYDNFAAGISFNTPYGSSLAWEKNWKGAHLIQDIALKAYSIQPTFSYKILENLSVGAGMMIQFGTVELSRALLPVGSLVPLLGPNYADVVPVQATLNGKANVRLGYNVGVMYDLNKKLSFGVSYRSKVMMKVTEGTASLEYASEAIKQAISSQVPPLDKGTFKAELPLPSNLNVGVAYHPTENWTVSGEVQFVGWAAYKELDLVFTENVLQGNSLKAVKDYKNTRIYRVGAEYKATHRLDLRAGIYYDESPVRSNLYNPETPGMDKIGISAGLSFRPLEYMSVDFAFLYTQGLSRDGSYPDPVQPSQTFDGRYSSNAISPSLGLSFRF